jgi:hypothetical protein
MGELFGSIANNRKLAINPIERQALAGKNLLNRKELMWEALPNDQETYGMLAGHFVDPNVALELKTFILPSSQVSTIGTKLMSNWKWFVTAGNPRGHVRNFISNIFLNHACGDHGMSVFNPMTWKAYNSTTMLFKGMNNPKNRAEIEDLAEKGLFTGGFSKHELRAFDDLPEFSEGHGIFNTIKSAKRSYMSNSSKLYNLSEQWAKVAKYKYLKGQGINDEEAVKSAMESTFDYNDVSPFVSRVRNAWYGAPFVTFSMKAMPAITKSFLTKPWRIGALTLGLNAMQDAAVENANMTPEEWERLKGQLPKHVTAGKCFMLPTRDSKGRLQIADLSAYLPWGDVTGGEDAVSRGKLPFLGKFLLGNPFYTTAAGLTTGVDYNGRKIWDVNDDGMTQASKVFTYTTRQALPTVMNPAMNFARVVNGAEKDPTAGQFILNDMLGMKVYARSEGQIVSDHMKAVIAAKGYYKKELKKSIEENPEDVEDSSKDYAEKVLKLYQ